MAWELFALQLQLLCLTCFVTSPHGLVPEFLVTFPAERAAAAARVGRAFLPPSACTSLDGPLCRLRVPAVVAARQPLDAPAPKETLEQEEGTQGPGRGAHYGSVAEAAATAASAVSCLLCRAVAYAAVAGSSASATERDVQRIVEGTCEEGQVPGLLQALSIVPTPEGAYALAGRGGRSALSAFELAAFKRTCRLVTERARDALAEATVTSLRLRRGLAQGAATLAALARVVERSACVDASHLCSPDALSPLEELGGTAASEVLSALSRREPCVHLNKGWWVYELCHNAQLRQYHVEGSEVSSVTTLGAFDSSATADVVTTGQPVEAHDMPPDVAHVRGLLPYTAVSFTGGDRCGLSGGRSVERRASVRYACSPSGRVHLTIREPSTCRYVAVVFHPELCAATDTTN